MDVVGNVLPEAVCQKRKQGRCVETQHDTHMRTTSVESLQSGILRRNLENRSKDEHIGAGDQDHVHKDMGNHHESIDDVDLDGCTG